MGALRQLAPSEPRLRFVRASVVGARTMIAWSGEVSTHDLYVAPRGTQDELCEDAETELLRDHLPPPWFARSILDVSLALPPTQPAMASLLSMYVYIELVGDV